MYKITSYIENGLSFVNLHNESETTLAKICLDQGARVQDLKFDDVFIIQEQENFEYENSFASSILFPFSSRVENGKYSFKGDEYQLNCNDKGRHALHGLVYNKKFEIFEPEEHSDYCSVTFNYFEKNFTEGFPFPYFFSITYTLYTDTLNVNMTVHNTGNYAFPYVLGWHPYFYCTDLKQSTLHFESNKKILLDENLIAKEVIEQNTFGISELDKKQLDDCFVLSNNLVTFKTPNYQMELMQSSKNGFLQLYSPKELPMIAVEPITGISNSFNNKIGLEVLEPNKTGVFKCVVKVIV